MRATVLALLAALSIASSAFAQPPSPQASASLAAAERGGGDWDQYVSIKDGFKIDFPGQPKITETTWKSEYGYMLPARIYTGDQGQAHYSVTVVDYNGIQKLGLERRAHCPSGAEPCQGGREGSPIGPGYSVQDIRGALVYASFQFIKRDATITHYQWNWEDLVEGHEIHLTNHADQSRTMAFIAMRENRLYILEGTVPKGYPEPGLFFQSVGWVDKDGNGIRYQQIYVNEIYGLGLYPEPGHNQGGQGQGGQAGRAGGPAAPQ